MLCTKLYDGNAEDKHPNGPYILSWTKTSLYLPGNFGVPLLTPALSSGAAHLAAAISNKMITRPHTKIEICVHRQTGRLGKIFILWISRQFLSLIQWALHLTPSMNRTYEFDHPAEKRSQLQILLRQLVLCGQHLVHLNRDHATVLLAPWTVILKGLQSNVKH